MKNNIPQLDANSEASQSDAAVACALNLGRALHTYGLPAHQLEAELGRLSRHLGAPADFFTTPTLLLASFGAEPNQHTYVVRTEPGLVDLSKLAELRRVTNEIESSTLDARRADQRVRQIVAAPPRYGPRTTVAGFALASASGGMFIGGGWIEVAVAGLLGMLCGLLALAVERRPEASGLYNLAAAGMVSFAATVIAGTVLPHASLISTLGGLIVLVPGLTLTVSINELATRNLVSGTARLMSALLDFVMIGFGVALGTRLGSAVAVSPPIQPVPLPGWVEPIMLLLAPIGLAILFRAPLRELPWIVLAGVLGYEGTVAGSAMLGPQLGAMVGAFGVASAANAYERRLGRPASIMMVPGLMLLVPGTIGFRSIVALIDHDVVAGTETAVTMILVATAIVAGLLLANMVLPPARRVPRTPRPPKRGQTPFRRMAPVRG